MRVRLLMACKWMWILMLLTTAAWGQWTEPQLVDSAGDMVGINTPGKEWCPYVTADGQTLYFSAWRRDAYDDIYVCHQAGEGWTEPVMLPFCLPEADERNPTVNATNDTLYFISYSGSWDIWWCFRTGPEDTAWSEPERMPEPINSTGIEFAVWATPDNQRLLFASWRISANGEDIYECRRDPTTATGWSNPVRLPGQLHDAMPGRPESYPSMGLDTTELFFREGGYGNLAVSHLTDSGWTVGDALPDAINRHTQETTPCITPDGRRLYFSSRYGEPPPAGDIWYSDRILSSPGRTEHPRIQGLRLNVYPNPVRDQFTILVEGDLNRLTLFDLLGRSISERKTERAHGGFTWTVSSREWNLPSGTYFVVGQNEKQVTTQSIQIVK